MFFSEPISVQIYNYIETRPLICRANQLNGFYINESLDMVWYGLRYVKCFF